MYLGFGWLPSYRENGVDEWTWARVNEYGLISAADREVLMQVPVGEYPITEVDRRPLHTLFAAQRLGIMIWSLPFHFIRSGTKLDIEDTRLFFVSLLLW